MTATDLGERLAAWRSSPARPKPHFFRAVSCLTWFAGGPGLSMPRLAMVLAMVRGFITDQAFGMSNMDGNCAAAATSPLTLFLPRMTSIVGLRRQVTIFVISGGDIIRETSYASPGSSE